jgi:hypothetical protein
MLTRVLSPAHISTDISEKYIASIFRAEKSLLLCRALLSYSFFPVFTFSSEDAGRTFLRNVGIHIPDYTPLYSRRHCHEKWTVS